jgi:hypothetical protein
MPEASLAATGWVWSIITGLRGRCGSQKKHAGLRCFAEMPALQ